MYSKSDSLEVFVNYELIMNFNVCCVCLVCEDYWFPVYVCVCVEGGGGWSSLQCLDASGVDVCWLLQLCVKYSNDI